MPCGIEHQAHAVFGNRPRRGQGVGDRYVSATGLGDIDKGRCAETGKRYNLKLWQCRQHGVVEAPSRDCRIGIGQTFDTDIVVRLVVVENLEFTQAFEFG